MAAQLLQQRLALGQQRRLELALGRVDRVDQGQDVVAAGQQQHHQRVADLDPAGAHLVEHAFDHVGELDDRVQAEQPGRTLDGVGGAKDRVHQLVFLLGLFKPEQGLFHLAQQLPTLGNEGLECLVDVHG